MNDEQRITEAFGGVIEASVERLRLSGVRADLEALGYAVGCADLCAASAGAPHIRQRLYWVADAGGARRKGPRQAERGRDEPQGGGAKPTGAVVALTGVADATGGQSSARDLQRSGEHGLLAQGRDSDGMAITESDRRGERRAEPEPTRETGRANERRAWDDYRLVDCTDGKARRVGTGVQPLAHGIPGRVGLLRAYGNAIVPQVTATFVKAFMDVA